MSQAAAPFGLTPREIDVLGLAADGKTAWESGRLLKVCESTARTHIKNAMKKLDAVTKAQAVAIAIYAGVISMPQPPMITSGDGGLG